MTTAELQRQLTAWEDDPDTTTAERSDVFDELCSRRSAGDALEGDLLRQAIDFMTSLLWNRTDAEITSKNRQLGARQFLRWIANANPSPVSELNSLAGLLVAGGDSSNIKRIVELIPRVDETAAISGLVALKAAVMQDMPGAHEGARKLATDETLDLFLREQIKSFYS